MDTRTSDLEELKCSKTRCEFFSHAVTTQWLLLFMAWLALLKSRGPREAAGVSPSQLMERVFLLSTGFGWGSVSDWKRLQREAWMTFIVTLVLLQANGIVLLNRGRWTSLIHIICISDEREDLNDSFTGQLFVYPLTLFPEKWKCITYGIRRYCPCIYVTLEVSKIFNFITKKLP